ALRSRLNALRQELSDPVFLESSRLTKETFDEQWNRFEQIATLWAKKGGQESENLIRAAQRGKKRALANRLRYWFYAEVFGNRFTGAERKNQEEKADLRYPSEWYPATRQLSRTVHLHVGPTNSGKTYHALKRLEQAERGLYLGPLRLLAHEVYTRLNSKGIPCALVTGEETRMPDEPPKMWSCTVEMAPLNSPLDVAVIDEIQMINHSDRGWAWTQSFLGVQAKEIHLCGEARAVPLIKELCALTGDAVQVHNYERLTPLEVAPEPLGSLTRLEKGDCIVVFSVMGIHALRREIETKTGRNCAMVYGSLPPETRAQQARLFNDPDNDYDFLVASDAVGMGLNLAIKRVIFESTVKHNGTKLAPLEISDLKQIAGRAGRYKTAHEANTAATAQRSEEAMNTNAVVPAGPGPEATKPKTVGIVTTLEKLDFPYLKGVMKREPPPIETAGLFPPNIIVERFAQYFPPGTPFSYILLRLHEISKIHPRFHLCSLRDQLSIADAIHKVKNLSISDRYTICAVPSSTRDQKEEAFLVSLVERIADGKSVNLLDLPELPLHILDEPMSAETSYLRELETLHKCIVVYLWLSYRFPNSVVSRKLANYAKKLTEDAIEKTLTEFTYTQYASKKRKRERESAIKKLGAFVEADEQE
ncbi:P-loop containing nucleoside triphosphate hydrolase protein, partial [Periconia macrospinosa]